VTNNASYIETTDGQRFFGDHGAAGSIVLSQKTGRLLLQQRSENVMESGTWGTFGGAIESGSNSRRTAMDELFEETGYEGPVRFESLSLYCKPGGGFSYQNYLAIVDDEFEPWQHHEARGARWFEFGDWPEPLHFGVRNLLADEQSVKLIRDFVVGAKRGENFVEGCPPAERTLYHCLYKAPEGEALEPTCRRNENGREDCYLFATPYLSKALAFSFSYHNGKDICMNGPLEGTPEEFAIICNRSETMAAPRPARVYAFSSEGFEPIPGARQYVSTNSVSFNRTILSFETNHVHDVMMNGVQVFSVEETPEQFFRSGGLNDRYSSGVSNEEMLYRLMRDGHAQWENWKQNVGASPKLLDRFRQMERCYVDEPRLLTIIPC
jgi:8-oxo-dGTP pyrophosphatase MutT (NUDIX family)